MKWPWRRSAATVQPRICESVNISATDDLLQRAEVIVHLLGFRGATGGYVINVYRVLQQYETLDHAQKRGDPP